MADEKKPVKPAAKPAGKPAAGAKKAEKKPPKAFKAGKNCPKCGAGVKLAEHKNRRSCGRCGYFEKV